MASETSAEAIFPVNVALLRFNVVHLMDTFNHVSLIVIAFNATCVSHSIFDSTQNKFCRLMTKLIRCNAVQMNIPFFLVVHI